MKKSIHKKWWFWLLIVLLVAAIGNMGKKTEPEASKTAISNDQSDKGNEKEIKESDGEKEIPVLDKEAVIAYTANIRGRTFVKEVQVGDQDITIQFFKDYKEYMASNPQSKITEDDYADYLGTGDAIHKILMEESARLLKEFPAANEIKITVPFKNKTYSVDLKEEVAEKFFNVDFNTLKTDNPEDGNEEWRAQVSDKYFNKKDRQKFVDEFVQVK
ncbi:hypothetical protein [Paenibacillus illinoisensis]|uniref:hypothetical protein n=1 Tax=Paenibacillus illinoisensis TaxID=59845 RepID=UPI0020421934|nr:hypothetical protein [Paenibacillus illinoisensis]MCM3206370.1 hypothetical protein [Paenibacillus illinoisensis]